MATETDSINKPKSNKFGDAALFALTYWARFVIWIQGVYYVVMGLWPLLNISSFLNATGPKTDIWLVKTVGTLLIVSGFVLMLAGYRRRVSLEMAVLGVGNALALIIVEVVYVSIGAISPMYFLDGVIEILLIIGWFRRGGPYD
jgi:hypothetical protein